MRPRITSQMQQAHADDHVDGVQPGHRKIEEEIELRVLQAAGGQMREDFAFGRPVEAGDDVLDEFLVVLVGLHAQERAAQDQCGDQEIDQRAAVAGLRRADGKRHGETAAEQDGGVGRAEAHIENVAAALERGEVEPAIDGVGGKQAAEEHDFSDQEKPDAEEVGFLLLLEVLELVREAGVMRRAGARQRHSWPASSSA